MSIPINKIRDFKANAELGLQRLLEKQQELQAQLQNLLTQEQQVREAMGQNMQQVIAAQSSIATYQLVLDQEKDDGS